MTQTLRFQVAAALATSALTLLAMNCTNSGPGSNFGTGAVGPGSSGGSGSSGGGSGGSSSGVSSSGGGEGTQPPPGDDSSGGVEGGGGPCPANSMYAQKTFVNLAVTPGAPLSPGENDPIPDGDAGAATSPAGWNFYGKDGALCRDGSPAGFYVHFASPASDKLFIYLEGGGACDSATFCSHNPGNLATVFSGGEATQGQTIGGSLGFSTTPQEPYVPTPASGLTAATSPGIFDFTQDANPFKNWNGVYIPYCTGDVHFGTLDNVDIPGDGVLPALPNQHFVGHLNFQKFLARIVPTFPNLSQVVLTGASAGGFAAGLSYGMVQDSFGIKIPVTVLDDSGPPFSAQYLPACLQKAWRDLWGFDAALPKDCAECFQADGSGLTNVVYYWLQKYPNAKVGIVSTMQDEVIRLFFAQGDMSCASNNATGLTAGMALGANYPAMEYTQGLTDLVTTFQCTGRLATYYIGGMNPNYLHPTNHQHIFRDEFYQAITNDGKTTMAQWATDLVAGKMDLLGP